MELTNSSDPTTEVRKAIEAGDNTVALMRGMLWGMLMLGSELRGIRNACEDIAAGVLFGPEQSTPSADADTTPETVTTAADILKRFVDGDNLVAYESDDLEVVHEDARTAVIAAQLLAIAEVGGRIATKMEAK